MAVTAAEFRNNMKGVLDAALEVPQTIIRGTDIFVVQKAFVGVPARIQDPPKKIETPKPASTRVEDLIAQEHGFDNEDEALMSAFAEPKNSVATRDKGDVLADIRNLEAEMKEALSINQDPDSRNSMEKQYRMLISDLWAEYRELAE